jgi:hypothetical protein
MRGGADDEEDVFSPSKVPRAKLQVVRRAYMVISAIEKKGEK